MRVLGIDPGSRTLGYGIIEQQGQQKYITSGCIKVADLAIPQRLKTIYRDLTHLILEYTPQYASIEQVFVHKNPQGALKLGQARGAAIVACACCDIEVYEYSPREIKQATVGYGNASKEQMQQMVTSLLGLATPPQSDAADALAAGLCFFSNNRYLINAN